MATSVINHQNIYKAANLTSNKTCKSNVLTNIQSLTLPKGRYIVIATVGYHTPTYVILADSASSDIGFAVSCNNNIVIGYTIVTESNKTVYSNVLNTSSDFSAVADMRYTKLLAIKVS